jgi:hypothetical protein
VIANVTTEYLYLLLNNGISNIDGFESIKITRSDDDLSNSLLRERLPLIDRYLSWEHLRTYGRLPLFGISLSVLLFIPSVFFLLAVYNDQIAHWQHILHNQQVPAQLAAYETVVASLRPLPLPALSFWLLISTGLLGFASLVFSLSCPPRVREFSLEQWMHEFGRPAYQYPAFSWSNRPIKAIVGPCYVIGGLGTLGILVIKLLNVGEFIISHSVLPWYRW